jgi:fumarylacetoacetase
MLGKFPPAFKRLPIAYNSRATSVIVSGTDVVRPNGQSNVDFDVVYGPEPWLDFELEMGAFVGRANDLGVPVPMRDADEHLFGYCLLNDWSARGIQYFESAPLGPFLGKSFATSISPWVVTADALEPYRVIAPLRAPEDAAPPHLDSTDNLTRGAFDIELEAFIVTPKMRGAGMQPFRLTATQFRDMYWTFAQMLAHHASNGCNLQVGDLLGSGTASGAADSSRACLGEITARGTAAYELPSGESRIWLEDGDEVIFRGHAVRDGYPRIGFGECRGKVLPAPPI